MILFLMKRAWLLKACCESFLYAWCVYLFLLSMCFTQVAYSRVCGQGKVIRQPFIGLQAKLYMFADLWILMAIWSAVAFCQPTEIIACSWLHTLARLESSESVSDDNSSGSEEILLIMAARYREMSVGTNTEPCLRPSVIGNGPERLPRWFVPSKRIQVRDTNRSGETKWAIIANIAELGAFLEGVLDTSHDEHQWFLLLTTIHLVLLHIDEYVDSTSQRPETKLGFWKYLFCRGQESVQKESREDLASDT